MQSSIEVYRLNSRLKMACFHAADPLKNKVGVRKIILTDIMVVLYFLAVLKIYRNCTQPVDVVGFYKS